MSLPPTTAATPRRSFFGTRGRVYGALAFLLIVGASALLLRPQPPGRHPSGADTVRTAPTAISPESTQQQPATDKANKDMASGPTLLGSVQTETRSLSVLQPARISAVLVHEGDRVHRGQLLIRLDDLQSTGQRRTAAAGVTAALAQLGKAQAGNEAQRVRADADIETARSGLTQAQEKLRQALLGRDAGRAEQQSELAQAQENVRKAQSGLDEAQRRLNSLTELSQVGGVARNDLESARTQVAAAQSDRDQAAAQVRRLQAGPATGVTYRDAQAQLDVTAAQQGVAQAQAGVATAIRARRQMLAMAGRDIQAAAAAVEQARAGADSARDATQLTLLTSPLDGIVTGLTAHASETAQPGAALIAVVATAGFHIEALATARQIAALHIGQQAQVTLETRAGVLLRAKLSAISPVAEPDGRSFRIKFRLISPPTDLRPGQNARITFPG